MSAMHGLTNAQEIYQLCFQFVCLRMIYSIDLFIFTTSQKKVLCFLVLWLLVGSVLTLIQDLPLVLTPKFCRHQQKLQWAIQQLTAAPVSLKLDRLHYKRVTLKHPHAHPYQHILSIQHTHKHKCNQAFITHKQIQTCCLWYAENIFSMSFRSRILNALRSSISFQMVPLIIFWKNTGGGYCFHSNYKTNHYFIPRTE